MKLNFYYVLLHSILSKKSDQKPYTSTDLVTLRMLGNLVPNPNGSDALFSETIYVHAAAEGLVRGKE